MQSGIKRVLSVLIAIALLVPQSWFALRAEASADTSIVLQQSFEDGETGGWEKLSWGGAGNVAVSADVASEGSKSLKFTNRASLNSSLSHDMLGLLQSDHIYDISFKVRSAQGSDSFHLASKVTSGGTASYPWLIGNKTVTGDAWTTFELKSYQVPSSTTEFRIWIESDSSSTSTADVYLDEVLIQDVTPPAQTPAVAVLDQGFEDNAVGGWEQLSWGGAGDVAVSTDVASAGSKSLKFSSRASRNSSLSRDLTDLLVSDHTYDLSFKVRLAGQGSDTFHLASKVTSDGTASYPWLIGNKPVENDAWTTFELKNYQVPSSTTEFRIWFESDTASTSTADVYLDEVLITDLTPDNGGGGSTPVDPPRDPAIPFTPLTFEDQAAGGFFGRAGTETLTVTNEANHTEGGSFALKVEGRTDSWHGPTLRVEKNVDKGYEYQVTAWVKLISPASSQIQLSTQVGNGSSANYVTLSAKTINASDGWVQFQGSYRYNNVSSEYLTIYVESSSNKTASFYIDDVNFVKSGSGPITIQDDLTPIKDAYEDDFLIGNAISAEDLDGVRLQLLKKHFNVATAGNAMKPDALQPTKGNFTFTAADALVDKVLDEGMQMHGHVLVWHQQTPTWMNTSGGSPLGREEALDNLKTHIETVMEHFGDKVISWDVVNEAMNDNPGNPADWKASLRQTPWYNAIGSDYIEQAFLAARAVLDEHPDWNIKLYYNDYNEDNQSKALAIYNMVKELNDNYAIEHPGKLLIDGVGMQAHYNVNTNPDNVRLSLEKFISLGVTVSVSEMDVQAGSNYQISEAQANAQGYLYAQLMSIFKEQADHIERVTFWGMDDNTSWRASTNPLLFDKNLQAKPAYYGVIDPDTFIEEHEPTVKEAKESEAHFATPEIDGTVDSVWSQTPEFPINQYQMAWQGATGTARALWDDQYLYVLVQVTDAQLDKASVNAYEQDSVEIFLDQNNAKTSFYQGDDGQYRINFDNETSFNPVSIATGFESSTAVSGTNYTVEAKIPLSAITPAEGTKLGFDVQINDAKDGSRQSVAAWNDTTGTGYMDTSVYGVLNLTKEANTPNPDPGNDPGTDPGPGPSTGHNTGSGSPTPPAATVENNNGVATIKPVVKSEGDRVSAVISNDNLNKALEQATAAANGKKQIVIEVPASANATSYEVQLPSQSLKGGADYELSLKTGTATIQIPSNMLSNVTESSEQVTLRVAKADMGTLNAATREQIGSHPVIELSVAAGDKVISWNNPNAPVTVSVPYKPTAAELSNPDSIVVWYIAGDGSVTAVPNGRYDAATGKVVFQTTHFSTYAVASGVKSFGDLANVPWAKQAIEAMAARDIIKGTSASSFSPAASIKRADFIALLVRALELKGKDKDVEVTFSDVDQNAYYYNELLIAKELGIATGFGDNNFKPDSTITRQDMMVLTTRALAAASKQVAAGGNLDAFADASSISAYAKDSAAALVKSGIVTGYGSKLSPNGSLTRAEAAIILYRIWKL